MHLTPYLYVINVFIVVTSIHKRQLKNKIQLETRKQRESFQKIQDLRERERTKIEIKLARKKVWGKRTKKCLDEEIVDAPFESNINTVVEKYPIRNYTC